MAAHGRGFCNPRSQRTRTAKKSDATALGGGRGACFRDLASELLVAGQSHGIGVPLLRGPRSRPGAWPRPADCRTGMRWPINPVHGRETDCRARTIAILRMALSGDQVPCCVRYPHWRTRAGERTRIHVPQPPGPVHLPVGLSRGWTSSPGPRGSAASRGNPPNPVRPPSCFRCRTFPCSYR